MTNNLYRAFCDQRRAVQQFRTLRETQVMSEGRAMRDGETLINFASNDYLGLSRNASVVARAADYAIRYGAGVTASRLVTGNNPVYAQIESMIARGKGSEAALVMNGGYVTNLTVLAALADSEVIGRPVTILADRLVHNSMLQGARLGGAKLARYHHNDMDYLAKLLQAEREKGNHVIIMTESVFGMDGDVADLDALVELKQRFDALLYVDEAHATGLYGDSGFGLCADYPGTIDIVMGTFGKALGSFGAYVACNADMRDYLIQRCGGFIYATGLPPTVLGSIEAALELVPQMQRERDYLRDQSFRLRAALQQQGWNTGASETHIIPVILGDEAAALKLSDDLRTAGILAPAIRPPTVPRGTSRIRFSLSAAHGASDIDALTAAMQAQFPKFAAAA